MLVIPSSMFSAIKHMNTFKVNMLANIEHLSGVVFLLSNVTNWCLMQDV